MGRGRPRVAAGNPTSRGCVLTPGPRGRTSTPRRSTARCSAAIRDGSTRPATARSSASATGAARAGSARRRPVHGRHVARRLGVRPAGSVRSSRAQNARRLAGPALQRLPQGAGAAALQMDAAVWDRRRLPQPLRRRDDQSRRARGTSTRCWPTSARVVIARGGSGR